MIFVNFVARSSWPCLVHEGVQAGRRAFGDGRRERPEHNQRAKEDRDTKGIQGRNAPFGYEMQDHFQHTLRQGDSERSREEEYDREDEQPHGHDIGTEPAAE